MRRTTILTWLCAGLSGCAALVGVDGDYHEVDDATDASVGGSNMGGVGANGTGGGGTGGGGTGGTPDGGGTGGTPDGGGTGGTPDGGGTGGGGTGGGPDGGTGGTAGSGTDCSSLNKLCAGAVPSGFTGPVTLREGASPPPACGGAYPTDAALALHGGLSVGTSSCDCSCGSPSITCPGPTLEQQVSATCAGGAYVETLAANVCEAVTVPSGHTISVNQPTPTFGTCASSSNNNFPVPTWNLEGRACGGAATDGTCQSGEICVPPAPSGDKLCVYQDGDVSCPTGYYSVKHLFYGQAHDTRDCTKCGCNSATGQCKGSVVFTSSCSSSTASGTISLGGCGGPFSNVGAAKYTPGVHTGSCTPTGGTFSGSVTPTNPVTLCCAQ